MAKTGDISKFIDSNTKFIVEVDGEQRQVTNLEYDTSKNLVKFKVKTDQATLKKTK